MHTNTAKQTSKAYVSKPQDVVAEMCAKDLKAKANKTQCEQKSSKAAKLAQQSFDIVGAAG